ncbi:hypothetical protein [Nocardia sp. NPDC024068]|uniref:hypothetical protein n=1 Tax=Nocardia sp. NPDC024068 TaxID=3157197 RepID=UPI0033FB4607
MSTTATLSAFLRDPNSIIDAMEETGDVVLTRRSAPALRLSNAAESEAETRTLEALTQLLALSIDDEMLERIGSLLSITFPWADLLPAHVRPDFVSEFLRIARACFSVGRFDRLTLTLEAWKSTAEAYADPSVTVDATDLHYFEEPEAVSDPWSGK